MLKNDVLQVNIEGYASDGSGVAKPDGYVLFIPGTIKGERVLCKVLKANKTYGYAKALEILSPAPSRAAPLCKAFSKCGGCELWHMSYPEQLEFKYETVCANLRKAGIDVVPDKSVPSPEKIAYRNKAQYPVRFQHGQIRVGFYRKNSHDIIEGKCVIQPDIFDKIARFIKKLMLEDGISAYDEQSGRGCIRHIYLRSSADLKKIMVCLVLNTDFDEKSAFAHKLSVQFKEICTVCINYNNKNTNVILGERYETVLGDGYIKDTLLGKEFEISPAAFYQVNHGGCERLYSLVKELAKITETDRVLDLYCGIGTIGICVADGAKKLTGVEIVPQAIENAKRNAQINGIRNAQFFAADAGDIENIANDDYDVIIVDPPRKGCDMRSLEFIKKKMPQRVIYVSCDSATLARDLKELCTVYRIERAVPVDMFPGTKHVETVVLMTRELTD